MAPEVATPNAIALAGVVERSGWNVLPCDELLNAADLWTVFWMRARTTTSLLYEAGAFGWAAGGETVAVPVLVPTRRHPVSVVIGLDVAVRGELVSVMQRRTREVAPLPVLAVLAHEIAGKAVVARLPGDHEAVYRVGRRGRIFREAPLLASEAPERIVQHGRMVGVPAAEATWD